MDFRILLSSCEWQIFDFPFHREKLLKLLFFIVSGNWNQIRIGTKSVRRAWNGEIWIRCSMKNLASKRDRMNWINNRWSSPFGIKTLAKVMIFSARWWLATTAKANDWNNGKIVYDYLIIFMNNGTTYQPNSIHTKKLHNCIKFPHPHFTITYMYVTWNWFWFHLLLKKWFIKSALKYKLRLDYT